MDVGKEFRIAHKITVYMKNLSTPEIFSILYDDPMDASTAEEYLKKVIHISDQDAIYGVFRNEITIHKLVDKEHLKDLLEEIL